MTGQNQKECAVLKNQEIICISMTFWDAVWLSNQQYMKRLAAQNRVLYVERPVTFLSYLSPNQREFVSKQLGRWWSNSIREVNDNLFIGSPPPVLPMRFERPINFLNQVIRSGWVRKAARKLDFQAPILWIYDPDAGQMIGRVGEKFALYAITDDHPSMAQRSNRIGAMRAREHELLVAADMVLTTTENLRESKLPYNPQTYYVPHGIDASHFARALDPDYLPMPELAGIPGPMIGIVGQINQRIDVQTLTVAATRHPEWTLVFIGPVVRERVDISTLESLPNVRFLGRKPAEDLPRYLKSMSLCLIPYIVDEHTLYMHHLKHWNILLPVSRWCLLPCPHLPFMVSISVAPGILKVLFRLWKWRLPKTRRKNSVSVPIMRTSIPGKAGWKSYLI